MIAILPGRVVVASCLIEKVKEVSKSEQQKLAILLIRR
jgi:hypothetical protein